MPDKWHTTKDLFADAYLLCAICRVQHTARALLCAKKPASCSGRRPCSYMVSEEELVFQKKINSIGDMQPQISYGSDHRI